MGMNQSLLLALVTMLMLTSLSTSYLISEKYNSQIDVIKISANPNQIQSTGQNIDFGNINNDTYSKIAPIDSGGLWQSEPYVGFVLKTPLPIYNYGLMGLQNVQPIDNKYVVTYYINNSYSHDIFSVFARYSGDANNIEILFKNDGVYTYANNPLLKVWEVLTGTFDQHIPVNINLYDSDIIVQTYYDNNEQTVDIFYNGQYLGQFTGYAPSTGGNVYYAVVRGYGTGFTIKNIMTNIGNPTQINQYTSVTQILGTTLDTVGLGWLSNMITILLTVIVWNVPEVYFPWWANLIFIKLPEFGIAVSVAMAVRG